MRKLKDKTRPQEQKDTYRRSEMEFGVAADAYRSDPTKKATRNGAVMISVVLALVAFAVVLAAFILALGKFTFAGIIVSVIVGLTVLSSVHVCMDWERVVVMRLGRFDRLAGPGLFFTIPLFEFCTLRVDQRMNATSFGAEEALTSDLVPLDVDAVLAVGLALEIAAFSGAGLNPAMQIAGLVIAPIASAILVFAGAKFNNKKTLAIVVCALLVIGVAIARYGFYATCAM